MKHSNYKRHIIMFVAAVTAIFVAASACNLTSVINPVDQVASEIEQAATQIPVDEIEENIDKLSTEIPQGVDDLFDLGDLDKLEATAQALQEGYESGEIPPDIPVVEGPTDDLFTSKNLVTYATSMPFDAVLAFYQDEMPKHEWKPQKENDVFNENIAILNFSKPNREAVISISSDEANNNTIVLISIPPK